MPHLHTPLPKFKFLSVCLCLSVAPVGAQFDPMGPGAGGPAPAGEGVKHNEDPIKIVHPTVDKKNNAVSIPAAFWNQKMTSWVEVAVCGRPSDFLHETVLSATTTKDIMERAMRDAGFHDADAWCKSVKDFPRIRGDHFLISLTVTRKDLPGQGRTPGDKTETYSLDELINFQGWGVPAGPYGWMFKGNPERDPAAATQPAPPLAEESKEDQLADRTRILRDDPQVALVFKGLQNQSQSYADHPLAYDDWIYPMMRFSRNYKLLPAAVYDSNGEIPVTMTYRKVNEEQFLTESAKLWHDDACKKYILEQLPTAKQIDKAKSELWTLLPELAKLKTIEPELRDRLAESDLTAQVTLLTANIEKGYATLDAAWATWAADHPVFETSEEKSIAEKELVDLKLEARRWKDHMEQTRKAAEQLAIAEQANVDLKKLDRQPQTDEVKAQRQKLEGKKLEARSAAVLAEDTQPREYWKWEQSRLDRKNDPRTIWIKTIDAQVELLDARLDVGNTGLDYARKLQSAAQSEIDAAKKPYILALARMRRAEYLLKLTNIDFEIEKRETFPDDPDLPGLKKQKQQIEDALKEAPATQTGK